MECQPLRCFALPRLLWDHSAKARVHFDESELEDGLAGSMRVVRIIAASKKVLSVDNHIQVTLGKLSIGKVQLKSLLWCQECLLFLLFSRLDYITDSLTLSISLSSLFNFASACSAAHQICALFVCLTVHRRFFMILHKFCVVGSSHLRSVSWKKQICGIQFTVLTISLLWNNASSEAVAV